MIRIKSKKILMEKLFFENSLDLQRIWIVTGVLLTMSIYYLIIGDTHQQPNREPFRPEEIEAIMNENAVNVVNANIDAFTDSEFETETASAIDTPFVSDSESDTNSDPESILDDPEIFFMPNVDFDVCPIEELKHFEFCSLYAKEIAEKSIEDEEIMEFLSLFTKEELATN